MVVGMDRILAASFPRKDFIGAARNHFIGVHVRLRARAGLPDDQRELVVEAAASDFGGSLLTDIRALRVEATDPGIHAWRSLLDESQAMDDLERHLLARPKGEIADRALGLRSPIGIGGNLD